MKAYCGSVISICRQRLYRLFGDESTAPVLDTVARVVPYFFNGIWVFAKNRVYPAQGLESDKFGSGVANPAHAMMVSR